ncbi:MAG: ROK family transcriptional regulator [Bacteroidota bacterium]
MQARRHKHERITRINSKVGRDINRSIILNTVRRRQPISRAEISAITRLNKSTVSSIVANLVAEDLLLESPDQGGGIGRNPVNLTVKSGRHFVGAISFDAPCSRVAIVDIDGTIKAREEIWTKAVSPESLVSQCIARLNAMRSAAGPHEFHGIGASVAGIVDSANSRVIHAANLGWNQVDLASLIRKHFPDVEFVSVENDAKAAALAELLLGSHRLATTNIVFLLLGAGIGAGIAINNRILGGNTHAAGEVGHMTVVDGGEPCPCGNAGCWELYASERAPVKWFSEAKSSKPGSVPLSLADVVIAARAGDNDALKALRLWAKHVGVGIGDLISILDPEAVVVGGPITQIWDLVREDIDTAARGNGAFARQRTTVILPSSLPDSPPLVGAAALTIRRIFADYSISL